MGTENRRAYRSLLTYQIRLWGNEPIIFLSSPTELTSAYEMDVYMEADGYKLYNWGYNKENDLSVLSVNEEEVKHSQCDMIDIIIVESDDRIDSTREERRPIKGFPFSTAPVSYYRIYGRWQDEMLE